MRRIKLNLANIQVEFADRELALKRIEDWATNGTYPVQVVYGPEGCGKSAWLKQSAALLRDLGFDVIYINPVEREFLTEVGVEDVRRRLIDMLHEATNDAWIKAVWTVIDLAREVIKVRRGKLAVLIDDAFQAIGLDKAAIYVKGLLGLIEYPPEHYERIITIAATSEGISKREIGRHRWASLLTIWNMNKDGFRQLYEQIPGDKLSLEDSWQVTGGNPWVLAMLHKNHWSINNVVGEIIKDKGLINLVQSLSKDDRELLIKALDDPDILMSKETAWLLNKLIELNLVIDNIYPRARNLWVDEPPPERDLELGVGRYVAWQTPIHREAIRKALMSVK